MYKTGLMMAIGCINEDNIISTKIKMKFIKFTYFIEYLGYDKIYVFPNNRNDVVHRIESSDGKYYIERSSDSNYIISERCPIIKKLSTYI